jgi:uncharacterized membrane protein HdeD (DUF308 family)
MTTVTVDVLAEPEPVHSLGWGWYLGAGIAWMFVGLAILTAQPGTIALIGFMVGGVLLLAGAFELVMAFTGTGWRWLHGLAGALFILGGILAFLEPFQTFVGLSILFGWYLVIMGTVVLVGSLATRIPGSLWGLGVTVGIFEILIGLWAIGYPGRSAWLLLLWVGVGAMAHGIADVINAFHVRSFQREVQS